ncbi:MAG: glycosyltransferase family 1 protein, partial [Magnetococcales bacterium]|nr:glycosyltransferase family 1 protein [Magnetococcales bacterium]
MRCLLITLRSFDYYDDLARACVENGIEVACVPGNDLEDGRRILETIQAFRPHFILNHPIFSVMVSRIGVLKGIPVLHWVVDKLLNRDCLNRSVYGETDLILSTYRDDVAKLTALGVRAAYLLNACNIEPVNDGGTKKRYGVSFVGTIELGVNNYYRRSMEHWQRHLSVATTSQAGMFEVLQQTCDKILLAQQEASCQFQYRIPELVAAARATLDPILRHTGLQPDDLVALLAKETVFHQRRHFLRAIPTLDAFGPQDWLVADLPNVHYHGVVALRASGQVFAASRTNLSLTRIYQLDGLSDRIFNVLRARGFLLANRQETMDEVFQEGVDYAAYATVEEMLDKIRFYDSNPQIRERIAHQGCEKKKKNHTF